MKAKDVTGEAFHHTIGDVDTLHTLAGMLPPQPVIINIGACFGTSTLAMLEARSDAYIFSIDINVCPKEAEHIEKSECGANRVVRILGPSQDIDWPYLVDMVFVDGAHGYPEVRRDIQAWRGKIRTGGVLAFHDYGNETLPHVKRAVDREMQHVGPFLQAGFIRAYII
jgi:predicted O-methyltransferase YrrM